MDGTISANTLDRSRACDGAHWRKRLARVQQLPGVPGRHVPHVRRKRVLGEHNCALVRGGSVPAVHSPNVRRVRDRVVVHGRGVVWAGARAESVLVLPIRTVDSDEVEVLPVSGECCSGA